jgi:hypothetical protein
MLGTAMKSKSRLVMEVESDHPESSAAVLDTRKIDGVSLILAPEDHPHPIPQKHSTSLLFSSL